MSRNKKEILSKSDSLGRAELIGRYGQDLKLDLQKSSHLLDTNLEAFIKALKEKNSLRVPCFGNFQVSQKTKRPGLNPKTQEKVTVTARKIVRFKTSEIFQKRLNNDL